jgi:hypothetical protein
MTIDSLGRIKSQAFNYIACGCGVLALGELARSSGSSDEGTNHEGAKEAVAFMTRAAIMGGTCATWVMTPEVGQSINRTVYQ